MNTGFVQIENEVLGKLTPRELSVYTILKSFRNGKTGLCIPSHATIARLTCASISTVKRAIKGLTEKGFIIKSARTRKDGGKTSNSYALLKEEVKELKKKYPAANFNSNPKEKKEKYNQDEIDNIKANFGDRLNDGEIQSVLKALDKQIEPKSENISKRIEYIRSKIALTAGQKIKNLVAWLIKAVKENWLPKSRAEQPARGESVDIEWELIKKKKGIPKNNELEKKFKTELWNFPAPTAYACCLTNWTSEDWYEEIVFDEFEWAYMSRREFHDKYNLEKPKMIFDEHNWEWLEESEFYERWNY